MVAWPAGADDGTVRYAVRHRSGRPIEDGLHVGTMGADVPFAPGSIRRLSEVAVDETEVARIPGVVAVDNRLRAREHTPTAPPLRRW